MKFKIGDTVQAIMSKTIFEVLEIREARPKLKVLIPKTKNEYWVGQIVVHIPYSNLILFEKKHQGHHLTKIFR